MTLRRLLQPVLSVLLGLALGLLVTLIAGESSEAYDSLFARIRAVVEPADMLEEIWVRDVTDLAW